MVLMFHLKSRDIMKLSIVTIGQSPRTDFDDFLRRSGSVAIDQMGVLDQYHDEIPEAVSDNILVSRMSDGSQVTIDKSFAVTEIKRMIKDIEQSNTDMVLLACTGEFEAFSSEIPIIYPDQLLCNIISTVFHEEICVLIPHVKQADTIKKKWSDAGIKTILLDISPYDCTEDDIEKVAEALDNIEVNHVICDCMGYNLSFKDELKKRTDKNIILSNEVVFSNIFALIS